MKRSTLPIVLHNPRILLVGGGTVASHKARVMARNKIRFDVIAAKCDETIKPLCHVLRQRNILADDCLEYTIIIDATGSGAVASMLLEAKRKHPFLLNVVDAPRQSDFFFAALVERGFLKVAVSSGGASPAIAQAVRDKIARLLPASLEALSHRGMQERCRGIIRPEALRNETEKRLGRVHLVGCGTGDADLLTLKAYRLIKQADVVLVDHLISQEILEIIPEKTLKIRVGKRKDHHSVPQEKINALLIEYASKGLEVARLKAGDPYIFGRGAEEAMALAKAGISVNVVPGICSAIAGPLSAGIAPTARGYATDLSIVTAHSAGNRINLEWIALLKRHRHTTIVLMGLSYAGAITAHALAQGVDAALPCAVISNASRADQQCAVTTLQALPDVAKSMPRPAIIVFGDVVQLHTVLPHYKADRRAAERYRSSTRP